MKILTRSLMALAAFAVSVLASAQTPECKIQKYNTTDGGILVDLTPNGKWGVVTLGTSQGGGNATPKLYNTATGEATEVKFNGRTFNISTVTDDGTIVAGSINGRASVFNTATNKLVALTQLRQGWQTSSISHITPDGKWAVGAYNGYAGKLEDGSDLSNDYYYSPLFINAETGDTIATPGLPKRDMAHLDQHAMVFDKITPDGRYIIGRMSWYIMQPASGFVFVYDTQTHTYDALGYTEHDNRPWEPVVEGLEHIEGAVMSPDGHWLAGMAYMAHPKEGSQFYNEYAVPYLYDIRTKEIKIFDDGETSNITAGAVDNAGTIFGNPENGGPLRDFRIFFQNKYWITLSQITKQVYGFNFSERTGYERTGTIMAVSGDGHSFISFPDPLGESYFFDFGMTAEEACAKVDLLDNYSVTPVAGSVFSQISTVEINFGRAVQVLGRGNTHVHLYKEDGTKVADALSTASGLQLKSGSKNTVVASFRTRALEPGVNYYVLIDEGAVAVASDAERFNHAIRINYTGRKDGPVSLVKAAPENHSQLRQIDASTSYVLLDFDCPVMLTDTPDAYIERVEDGSRLASLTISVGNTEATKRQVLLTASSEVNLYEGEEYKVVLAAGSVTDYSGLAASKNEKIELTYHGTYVREVSNDEVLFSDNFSDPATSYSTWLRYEGDHNTPLSTMAAWGFNADQFPWYFQTADDATYSNIYASSHSVYSPSGTSNDWLLTPQLIMPDDGKAVLEFDAQSYDSNKKDVLKLFIYEQERVLSYLNDANMAVISSAVEPLDEITLSAGANKEITEGEWTHYRYPLSKWAGKNIYICFVNQNTNQSAIFLDNVVVQRELLYTLGFSNEERVVNKSEIAIAGQFTVKTTEDFTGITLALKDAAGKEISRIEWPSATTTAKDRAIPFTFDKPLPLTVGEENKFTIDVTLGTITDTYKGTITDLAFQTTKHVVLEEMTGIDCPNCPQGILVIEKLERTFGEQFIPISIHTYTGDPYAGTMGGYSAYLGLQAAPSARINRIPGAYFPMVSVSGTYYDTYPESPVWYDIVAQELNKLSVADLTFSAQQSEDGKKIDYNIDLCYALNAANQQLSLFLVVLENGIEDYQANNLGGMSQDIFGIWGAGGINSGADTGGYAYPVIHNDIARSVIGQTMSGTIGLFPSELKAGQTYSASLSSTYPEAIADVHNATAVAMLIDTQTGEVLNAAKAPVTPNSTGITGTASNSGSADIYTLSGVLVRKSATRSDISTLPAGLYIHGGKKILVK